MSDLYFYLIDVKAKNFIYNIIFECFNIYSDWYQDSPWLLSRNIDRSEMILGLDNTGAIQLLKKA